MTAWSLAANDLLDKLSTHRWIPRAANIGAFALLIYAFGQATARLVAPAASPASSPPIVHADTATDLQPLLGAQLFGRLADTGPGTTDSDRLSLSNLDLVLTGVFARAASSVAVLSVNGAPETSVTVGQEVTTGAILDAVYPDRVVLRRGEARELVLLRDSSKLPPGSVPTPVPAMSANTLATDRRVPIRESGVQLPPISPVITAGTNGFVVPEVQRGSAFEQLGLRPGDVVRRVNGQLVSSSDGLLKRYAETVANPGGGHITIEVSRLGKTETLSYPVK